MPTPREASIWGKIRTQLSDAQKMILDGRYRDAVILDEEVLKTIVGMQVDRACLVTNTLEADIDQLFEGRYISAKSQENYHSIRIYGEQAEAGDTPTAQAANDSYYKLKDELETYINANQKPAVDDTEEEPATPRNRAAEIAGTVNSYAGQTYGSYQNPGVRRPIQGGDLDIPIGKSAKAEGGSARTGNRKASSGRASGQRSGQRRPSKNSGRQSGRGETPVELDLYTILKFAIPIACVILVIILVRVLMSGGSAATVETTPAAVESTIATEETTTVPETTTAPETTAAPQKWVTTTGVKVRTAPNTTDSKVLDVLDGGTEVEFVEDAGDWIKVNFQGQEAYISKQFVKAETA